MILQANKELEKREKPFSDALAFLADLKDAVDASGVGETCGVDVGGLIDIVKTMRAAHFEYGETYWLRSDMTFCVKRDGGDGVWVEFYTLDKDRSLLEKKVGSAYVAL